MDLATLIAIATCTGHCKRVVAPMDLIGVSTIAECRSILADQTRRKTLVKMDGHNDITIYRICVAASPHAISGHRIFRGRWWNGRLTGSG